MLNLFTVCIGTEGPYTRCCCCIAPVTTCAGLFSSSCKNPAGKSPVRTRDLYSSDCPRKE